MLVYLNAICGITIITMAHLRFNSDLQTMLLFLLVVISMSVGFGLGKVKISPGQPYQINESSQEKKANRLFRSILLVSNFVAFLVLLLFIPLLVAHPLTIVLLNSLFLVIICFDFGGLGMELARKLYSKARNQEVLFS